MNIVAIVAAAWLMFVGVVMQASGNRPVLSAITLKWWPFILGLGLLLSELLGWYR